MSALVFVLLLLTTPLIFAVRPGYVSSVGACGGGDNPENDAGPTYYSDSNCLKRCNEDSSCTGYHVPVNGSNWCETFTSVGATGDGRSQFQCFMKEHHYNYYNNYTTTTTTPTTTTTTTAPTTTPFTGNEIRKVTLELWNKDWCGTDDGPTFEIRTQKGETRRVTRSFSPANLGDTLQWDNFNGKLGNGIDNSGNVSGLKVSGASLRFKLIGQSWDDFCPKSFKVVTYDGTVYRSSEMNDWVDKGKGNHYRTAYKV